MRACSCGRGKSGTCETCIFMMHCRLDINDSEKELSESLIVGSTSEDIIETRANIVQYKTQLSELMFSVTDATAKIEQLEKLLETPIGSHMRRQYIIRKWSLKNRVLPHYNKEIERVRGLLEVERKKLKRLSKVSV